MPEITVPLRLPELAPGAWVNGGPVSLRFARGAVVLVDFWEATCVHCLRTLPYVAEWHRRYGGRGLVVVGVHTPEFEASRGPGSAAAVVRARGLAYPILLDDDRTTWRRFANHYWPAKYLADHRGYLRWEHFGEGAYAETERFLQRLLAEAGDRGPFPEPVAPLRAEDRTGAVCRPASRELYLGWHRGRLASVEGYRAGREVLHVGRSAAALQPGAFLARGLFLHQAELLEAREGGAEIELLFDGAGAHAVLAPPEAAPGAVTVEVELDGVPVPGPLRGADLEGGDGRTVARFDRLRSLHLVEAGSFGRRRLRLRFLDPGTRAFSLSFTSCCDRSG